MSTRRTFGKAALALSALALLSQGCSTTKALVDRKDTTTNTGVSLTQTPTTVSRLDALRARLKRSVLLE